MRTVLIILSLSIALLSTQADASLKVIGKGDKIDIDSSSFPQTMKQAYSLMKVKCTKCHTLERTVVAVSTGVAPISSGVFDRGATRAYGTKMLRKPDSNMTKQDVKVVVDLLNFMLEEAAK